MAHGRAERRFTLNRKVPAPRSVVFDAWTEPEHLAWFYNPAMPVPGTPIQVDLTVGGVWRQHMVVNDDLHYPTGGVYLEIVPDERLVFRWGATGGWPELGGDAGRDAPIVTVTLRDDAIGTHLELEVAFPDRLSDEQVGDLIEGGTREGWSATIDRLIDSTAITARQAGPGPNLADGGDRG